MIATDDYRVTYDAEAWAREFERNPMADQRLQILNGACRAIGALCDEIDRIRGVLFTDDPDDPGEPEATCKTCGVKWSDHLGIMGTCAQRRAALAELRAERRTTRTLTSALELAERALEREREEHTKTAAKLAAVTDLAMQTRRYP